MALTQDDLEQKIFGIISAVGTAKSQFISAIRAAKEGNFELAEQMVADGSELLLAGHKSHAALLEEDMNGTLKISLILVHAEDQFMAADSFKVLALEFISVYKTIKGIE